jgi:hypothetical protein
MKVVRRFFPEPFHRNVLGGCLFVIAKVSRITFYGVRYAITLLTFVLLLKDIANLMYRYEKVRQKQSRRIQEYR